MAQSLNNKVNYARETKSQIRDSANAKGANIVFTDTFRAYADKIAGIVSAQEALTATGEGETTYNGLNVTSVFFDVYLPNEVNGVPVTMFSPLKAIAPAIYRLYLGSNCKELSAGADLANIIEIHGGGVSILRNFNGINFKQLEEFDFPALLNITQVMFNNVHTKPYHVNVPALTSITTGYSDFSGLEIDGSWFKAPALETVNMSQYAFTSKWDENSDFSGLKVLKGALFGFLNGSKVYLPAITEISGGSSSGYFGKGFSLEWTETDHFDVYIGANLATLSGNALDITFKDARVTVHIPEGDSVTKTTLDGLGVSYVQDYAPTA